MIVIMGGVVYQTTEKEFSMRKKPSISYLVIMLLVSCNRSSMEVDQSDLLYSVNLATSDQVQILGSPFEVSTNNCGHPVHSIESFERSRQFTISVIFDVSLEISAEMGVDVATLQDKIGSGLKTRFGLEVGNTETISSKREIETPPDSITTVVLQWEELWTPGSLIIDYPDGSRVREIPFRVLTNVHLTQIGVETLNCNDITPTSLPPSPTSTQISIATSAPTSVAIYSNTAAMVLIPAGQFEMGQVELMMDSRPIHTVYLNDYFLDIYEVTNAQYAMCVDAGVCEQPKETSSMWPDPQANHYGMIQYSNHPVTYVNWFDANTYCEWRGARLPTEAEWEKAARGTDGRIYPWGEGIDCEHSNVRADGSGGLSTCVGDTTPVGSYSLDVSPYGIYDMAGNVSEWVRDWYEFSYYQNSPVENPIGPEVGTYRSMRGGSWFMGNSSSASRIGSYAPINLSSLAGFRCAKSP